MISREINNIYHVGRLDDTEDSLGRHDVGYHTTLSQRCCFRYTINLFKLLKILRSSKVQYWFNKI